MPNPVETTELTKRYGSTVAVENLSLSVPPGQVYGFLGPNGAGKTTTLRMLLGLIHPTSGGLRLPGPDAGALAAALGAPTDTPGVSTIVGSAHATIVVAAYLVAFCGVGGWLFARRDIT